MPNAITRKVSLVIPAFRRTFHARYFRGLLITRCRLILAMSVATACAFPYLSPPVYVSRTNLQFYCTHGFKGGLGGLSLMVDACPTNCPHWAEDQEQQKLLLNY